MSSEDVVTAPREHAAGPGLPEGCPGPVRVQDLADSTERSGGAVRGRSGDVDGVPLEEDSGPDTLGRYRYQAEIAAQDCLSRFEQEAIDYVVCEWHEDFVVAWAGGSMELVSVILSSCQSGRPAGPGACCQCNRLCSADDTDRSSCVRAGVASVCVVALFELARRSRHAAKAGGARAAHRAGVAARLRSAPGAQSTAAAA